MPVIIGVAIFLVLILIFVFIGPKIDRKDTRKKQIRILEEKGYKLDMSYLGKGLTKFDIYLDTKHKKILLFNGKFLVYNFKDLENVSITKEVNEGIYKYLIDFRILEKDYNIVLKGNISENKKIKYEELAKILNYVDNVNKDEEKKTKLKKTAKAKSSNTKKTTSKTTKASANKKTASLKKTTNSKTTTKKTTNKNTVKTTSRGATTKKKSTKTTKTQNTRTRKISKK